MRIQRLGFGARCIKGCAFWKRGEATAACRTACAVHITYTIGCLLDRGGGEHCMRGEVCMHGIYADAGAQVRGMQKQAHAGMLD